MISDFGLGTTGLLVMLSRRVARDSRAEPYRGTQGHTGRLQGLARITQGAAADHEPSAGSHHDDPLQLRQIIACFGHACLVKDAEEP